MEYLRLEPGTFVRFTPASAAFQNLLTEHSVDLEALLQSTLMQHTALSEGDWLTVAVPGAAGAEATQRLQVWLFATVCTHLRSLFTGQCSAARNAPLAQLRSQHNTPQHNTAQHNTTKSNTKQACR